MHSMHIHAYSMHQTLCIPEMFLNPGKLRIHAYPFFCNSKLLQNDTTPFCFASNFLHISTNCCISLLLPSLLPFRIPMLHKFLTKLKNRSQLPVEIICRFFVSILCLKKHKGSHPLPPGSPALLCTGPEVFDKKREGIV